MHAHRLPRVAGLLLALTILAFFGLHTGDAFAAGAYANVAAALSTQGYGAVAPLPRRAEVEARITQEAAGRA